MLKNDLREQGCLITEHHQKHGQVSLIWIFFAVMMIAAIFVSSALIDRISLDYSMDESISKYIFDFFNNTAGKINSLFEYHGMTSIIYLLIWTGIFYLVYYSLKDTSDRRETDRKKAAAVKTAAVMLILSAIFFFMVEIAYEYDNLREVYDFTGNDRLVNVIREKSAAFPFFEPLHMFAGGYGDYGYSIGSIVFLIFCVFLYFALKLIMTIIMCSNKYGNIKFKLLDHSAMPVCHCREGLKILPAGLIYFLPAAFIYSVVFIMTVRRDSYTLGVFFAIIIFLTFFISFDLAAAVYILYFKIKCKADYIALDNHIYDVTVYKKTYTKTGTTAGSYINVSGMLKQREKEKLFIEMYTCINNTCGNYALALESKKSGKRCPACGRRKYIAKVFTGMITCTNQDCEQFGQELKEKIDECTLCGAKVGQIALKFNPGLAKPSVIAAAAVCIVYSAVTLAMHEFGVVTDEGSVLLSIVNLSIFALYAAGIITAWISASKKALAAAIAALPVITIILRAALR